MDNITNDDVSIILGILNKTPLLQDLNEEDHKEIIKQISLELYPQDHIIFDENEAGDAFYIIKKGMVRVYHKAEDPDDEKDLAMLSDNDFFGEMALISEKPRNATTKTVEETECFKLLKGDFIKLVSSNPNMASRISSEFLKRLKINMRSEADAEE